MSTTQKTKLRLTTLQRSSTARKAVRNVAKLGYAALQQWETIDHELQEAELERAIVVAQKKMKTLNLKAPKQLQSKTLLSTTQKTKLRQKMKTLKLKAPKLFQPKTLLSTTQKTKPRQKLRQKMNTLNLKATPKELHQETCTSAAE